ncbi:MAG: hypothetical protein K0S93_762 [Nitrososphaeraceae archaeon]|nr:hypothetical protein [Nitrososphaeraceae archaeon]
MIKEIEQMSSIESKGENEFNYDETNIVGKSEKSEEEENEQISTTIKKEIMKDTNVLSSNEKDNSK